MRPLGIIGREHIQHVDQSHPEPAHGAAPEFRGVVAGGVGPGGSAALVVCVIKKAFRRLQVAGVDDQLLGGFVVSIRAVAEETAIAHEKRHAHEHAIAPELVRAAGAGCVPEPAIGSARISVKALPYLVGRQFVFFLLGFLVQEQEKIGGHDGIEAFRVVVHVSLAINVQIDPAFDILQVAAVPGPLPDEILAKEEQCLGVSP